MVDNEYCGPDLSELWKPSDRGFKGGVQRWHIGPRTVCRLYFITAHPDDMPDAPIKIGISFHPEARLAELQASSPARLIFLRVRTGGRKAERRYHEQFASDRLHGEWFRRSEPLMQAIRCK